MTCNTHSFNVCLATQLGIEQAILLHHFFHWHQYCKNKEGMIKEGRVWFYTSRVQIREVFPYLSEQKVKTAIGKLVEGGYVIIGNYNVDKFKKTNWYSLTDKALDLFEEITDRLVKTTNEQLNQPTKEYNNKDNIDNKKEKSINRKEIALPFDSPRLRELWCELMDYEEWKKKSNHAIELRIKKLERVAGGDVKVAIASIKQTLDKVWEDFYPPKNDEYFDKEPTKQRKPIWEELGMTKEQYLNITNK